MALRLATLALVLLGLGGLELGLRALGVGVPTAFFVPAGPDRLATNPRFGWRFFAPALARAPVASELAVPAPRGRQRVVVLGGSAALGTPDADFGLAAQLEAMLQLADPGREVEVVNAAMAAIDSHVVREIANDLALVAPDVVVVYLGNNEVVGPLGPTSELGRGLPWPPALRLAVVARELRLAQALGAGVDWVTRRRERVGRWRGMEMFLERRIEVDDPALDRTAAALRSNLGAIVDAARRAGAQVVVGTMAVDVLDSPPFGSVSLEPGATERLEAAKQRVESGDLAAARAHLEAVLERAPGHAEATWLLGRVVLAGGEPDTARELLDRARDLDTLRFRADSRIDRVIREVAAERAAALIEVARALDEAPENSASIAGNALFWEHVHLTPIGTYRAAAAFLPAVAGGLGRGELEAPESAAVFARLGMTADDLAAMTEAVAAMTARPPFSGQYDHPRRQEGRTRQRLLARANARSRRAADRQALLARVAAEPADPRARRRLARFLAATGDPKAAEREWRTLVAQQPSIAAWRLELGLVLLDQGRSAEARDELAAATRAMPWSPVAWTDFGLAAERAGELVTARKAYQRALELDPGFEAAALDLATLAERQGDLAGARSRLVGLVESGSASALATFRYGAFLEARGELDAAEHAYRAALELDPELARAHNNLGGLLERAGEREAALAEYRAAIATDPFYALPRFNLADLLLAYGAAAAAAEQYRLALELDPTNHQGRLNLERAVAETAASASVDGSAAR